MRQFAEIFYKSAAWVKCRNSYMKSVGCLCEKCLEEGKIVPAEEVHHKIFLTPENINDPGLTLSSDNLIALCREHHRREHGTQKRYKVDEMGRVTAL